MKQQFNKTLLTLVFLLPVYQVVLATGNEVGEAEVLTECYPQQTIRLSLSPIPEGYPICDGIIEPTDRATFEPDTGKVILPAVRVNEKAGYLYSLELSLLSTADDPFLKFEMTHYCLIQESTPLPAIDIATLSLPPGRIHIPAIDIGGITYSASLNLEQPSTQVWEESEIFTRKTKRIIFKVPRREVREAVEKPKYPVLLVHGLDSDGKTWKKYYKKKGWWTSKGLKYGGNIYIRDKYHLFEPGMDANKNNPLRRRLRSHYLSFFEIKVKKNGEWVDEANDDFYTMNFSNNNDISFAAQGLELKAIVNQIDEWTGGGGVYVVAHDIGGLATRAYLQLYNDDKVKGLITIATPHNSEEKGLWKGWRASEKEEIINEDLKILDQQSNPLPNEVNYFFVTVKEGQSITNKGEKANFSSLSDKEKNNLTGHSAIEEKIWDKIISW